MGIHSLSVPVPDLNDPLLPTTNPHLRKKTMGSTASSWILGTFYPMYKSSLEETV